MRKTIAVMLAATAAAFSSWPVVIEVGEDTFLEPRDILILESGELIVTLAGPFTSPEIICIDSRGSVLWHNTILESGDMSRAFESGGFLVPIPGGFAAAFHSEPRATGVNTDVAIAAFDKGGEPVWTYVLGLEDQDNWMCSDMISCTDGGILIIGSPGTMLPGGYALKLDSNGGLLWKTATDVMEEYPVSAAENSSGDYICLQYAPWLEQTMLQPISPEGELLPPAAVVTDGITPHTIHDLQGSLWLVSRGTGGFLDGVGLDDELAVNRAMSAVLPGNADIRHISSLNEGFLLAGAQGDSAYTAILDTGGNFLREDFLYTGGSCVFTAATEGSGAVAACGIVFGQDEMPVSFIVDKY